jgi:hypothetical protein
MPACSRRRQCTPARSPIEQADGAAAPPPSPLYRRGAAGAARRRRRRARCDTRYPWRRTRRGKSRARNLGGSIGRKALSSDLTIGGREIEGPRFWRVAGEEGARGCDKAGVHCGGLRRGVKGGYVRMSHLRTITASRSVFQRKCGHKSNSLHVHLTLLPNLVQIWDFGTSCRHPLKGSV